MQILVPTTLSYSKKNQNDSLPPVMNDADAVSPQNIKLTYNFGAIHKHNHEAIIRFHKPNKEKNLQHFMNQTDVILPLER